jgi:hypothetical protein
MFSTITDFLNPFSPNLFHLILWPLLGSVLILVLPTTSQCDPNTAEVPQDDAVSTAS